MQQQLPNNGPSTVDRRQLRNWCFTLNNPGERPDEWGSTLFKSVRARYLIFQLEKGDSGTPHFQGYIEFNRGVRFQTIKKYIPGAHFEARRGSRKQAIDYCRKTDTRVDGPWEFGESSLESQGTRSDLLEVCEGIKSGMGIRSISEQFMPQFIKYSKGIRDVLSIYNSKTIKRIEDKEVILIYGDTGIGKSYWVRSRYADDIYIKNGTHKWWDGYVDQRVVCIDDFAGGRSGFPLCTTLNILDKWDCQVEIKGGTVVLTNRVLFITTNIHPRDWYDYGDREVHYRALARRISQVWTINSDRNPECLIKDSFFESFRGFSDYPISTFATPKIPDNGSEPVDTTIDHSIDDDLTPTQIITISSEEEEEEDEKEESDSELNSESLSFSI